MKGILTESRIQDIYSGLAETDIEFGEVVVRGVSPERGVRPYNGQDTILGIAMYDPTKGTDAARKYRQGDAVAVVRKGVVLVEAGPTAGMITPGTKLAILKVASAFPTTAATVAARATGDAPGWGTTAKVAYTLAGPWGETALRGISETFNCQTLAKALDITVPGKAAVPKGTTHLKIYVSDDNGATWLVWTAGIIPYESLANGATHTIIANADNDDLGTATPPPADPTFPAVGAVLPDTDTRDILVVNGTEIVKGGSAGQEVWVELNLPA